MPTSFTGRHDDQEVPRRLTEEPSPPRPRGLTASGIALLLTVLSLLTLGLVMLFSVSAAAAAEAHRDSFFFLKRQLMYAGLGLMTCLTAAMLDYNLWRRYSRPLLAGALVLLALCFVPPIGLKVNGARRWLNLGGFRMQPSDVAKFALVVFLAAWVARHQRKIKTFRHGFLVPMVATGAVSLLIFIEPDFGTTALTAAAALALLFVAGTRLRYLAPTVLLGAAAFSFAVMHNPVRMQRILAFLDPQGTAKGAGYQTWQSLLALGSGGLTGRGLGNSGAKYFYLPEARTDFILAVVGEELGLIGTLGILIAFVIVLLCGIRIAMRAREFYGAMLAFGLTSLICMQALLNIGVVTGALPNKGLPLPFISFGGSNLVMSLLSIGVLLSIARHAEQPEERPTMPAAPLGQKWREA